MILFLVSKVKCQGHRVSKFIVHTRTLHTRTAIHRHSLGGVTRCRRRFEIGIECLLVQRLLDYSSPVDKYDTVTDSRRVH